MLGLLRQTIALLAMSPCWASGLPGSHQTEQLSIPSACKATPDSDDWPTQEVWAGFNASVDGRLIQPPPPAAICHQQPVYDETECASVTNAWMTYDFHQNDPISSMWNQYNNDTCLPIPDAPCSAAGYPAYAINATTAEHVKLSLLFAGKYNVRVVVKSSGHDYQGRSTAPGALTIWIHHMQSIEVHDSFQPQQCSTTEANAVTAAGGTQMVKLYEELDKINRAVVGGNSQSVSVGGYITGGGHSILSPRYGLAVDNVLEMQVVTPAGDFVTANECQNRDLFWAMRGGGGSTFGVMTSVTMKTHPTPEIVGLDVTIAAPKTGTTWFWDAMGYLMSQFPYLDSKGVAGYSYVLTNSPTPFNSTDRSNVDLFSGFFVVLGTRSNSDMDSIWAPVLDHLQETWPDTKVLTRTTNYTSHLNWFNINYDRNTAGKNAWVGSHLMDAQSLEDPVALSQAWKTYAGASFAGAFLVAGNATRNAQPRGGGNAVSPAWRKTIMHAINSVPFEPFNATARQEALVRANSLIEPLRKLAPDMGAYVNENNRGEPDWKHSFWGNNYARLLEIKREVDPDDVLWCNPCVGNERWREDGDRLCRVEDDDL